MGGLRSTEREREGERERERESGEIVWEKVKNMRSFGVGEGGG